MPPKVKASRWGLVMRWIGSSSAGPLWGSAIVSSVRVIQLLSASATAVRRSATVCQCVLDALGCSWSLRRREGPLRSWRRRLHLGVRGVHRCGRRLDGHFLGQRPALPCCSRDHVARGPPRGRGGPARERAPIASARRGRCGDIRTRRLDRHRGRTDHELCAQLAQGLGRLSTRARRVGRGHPRRRRVFWRERVAAAT